MGNRRPPADFSRSHWFGWWPFFLSTPCSPVPLLPSKKKILLGWRPDWNWAISVWNSCFSETGGNKGYGGWIWKTGGFKNKGEKITSVSILNRSHDLQVVPLSQWQVYVVRTLEKNRTTTKQNRAIPRPPCSQLANSLSRRREGFFLHFGGFFSPHTCVSLTPTLLIWSRAAKKLREKNSYWNGIKRSNRRRRGRQNWKHFQSAKLLVVMDTWVPEKKVTVAQSKLSCCSKKKVSLMTLMRQTHFHFLLLLLLSPLIRHSFLQIFTRVFFLSSRIFLQHLTFRPPKASWTDRVSQKVNNNYLKLILLCSSIL